MSEAGGERCDWRGASEKPAFGCLVLPILGLLGTGPCAVVSTPAPEERSEHHEV